MITVINVARDRTTPHVYIGRAWAGRPASPWGNPFRGAGAVERYRRYAEARPGLIRRLSEELERTGTSALGCWCKRPGVEVPCHGDVLAELVTRYREQGKPAQPDPDEATRRYIIQQLTAMSDLMQRKTEVCFHCGKPVERLEKVGRCVYAVPCNCRLYQGSIPDAWRAKR